MANEHAAAEDLPGAALPARPEGGETFQHTFRFSGNVTLCQEVCPFNTDRGDKPDTTYKPYTASTDGAEESTEYKGV